MKIGIYNPRAGTKSAGGTETFIREIIEHCDQDVELFTGEGKIHSGIDRTNINIHQTPVMYKENRINNFFSKYTPLLSAEIESLSMYINVRKSGMIDQLEACDVVATHYYADNALISRAVNTPTVFHSHGIKNPSVRWQTMFTIDNTDIYIANSKSTADRLEEWYDISVADIIYPGIDANQFCPSNNNKLSDQELVVLFVGRLDEGKGIPDLIEAFDNLNGRLRIVGDGNRRKKFESLAEQRLDSDSYEFVGEISHSEIHKEYQSADIFCLPSYHESFGIVVLEALACGLPVITTNLDAIDEYINDGENALLFEPGDVSALKNELHRLADSEDLRDQLSSAGREAALKYSWQAQTDKMIKAYRRLVE